MGRRTWVPFSSSTSSTGVETVLYSFSDPPDGSDPVAGLVVDSSNNLYRTTARGVHTATGLSSKSAPPERRLSFIALLEGPTAVCLSPPSAGMVSLNLYGTTTVGGRGYGTLFESTAAGSLNVLYTFCTLANCIEGATPTSFMGNSTAGGYSTGTFYGTTSAGGAYGIRSGFWVGKLAFHRDKLKRARLRSRARTLRKVVHFCLDRAR